MNAFDYIDELKTAVRDEAKKIIGTEEENKPMTKREHLNSMYTTLSLIEKELEMAEYNYKIMSYDKEVRTFEELPVIQTKLKEDLILFQPMGIDDADISAVDIQNLADVLLKLHDNGIIKENIMILPPNVNVFKAVLAKPVDENKENDEE